MSIASLKQRFFTSSKGFFPWMTSRVLCARHFWCSTGRSGKQVVLRCVQTFGAGGLCDGGLPITASLPGSNMIVATQLLKLFWKLAQDVMQSAVPCFETFDQRIRKPAAPSLPESAGHFPHTSLQSAGDQAFITASASPAGAALPLMHISQLLHQLSTLGSPAAPPRLHKRSTGSYPVKSGVSRAGFICRPRKLSLNSETTAAHIVVMLSIAIERLRPDMCDYSKNFNKTGCP